MRFLSACALAFTVSTPAWADLQTAVEAHILPGYAAFSEAGQNLAQAAQTDCTPAYVLPYYHAAYDTWISISHIQFGPIEARNFNLALAFWPDPKDRTGKALTRLIAAQDDAVANPKNFQEVSVAAQGFSALERLLTEEQDEAVYACVFTQAIAIHIADVAQVLNEDWKTGFADAFVTANDPTYQTEDEAQRALYTALSTALEFMHDQRIGRPLGTFDRPRPTRAEARRSERSLRHISLSLVALKDLTETGFSEAMTDETRTAFDVAIERANSLDDLALAGVADPSKRFKIEVLQRMVRDVQVAVAEQIGAPLGISAGFNSLDGD